MSTYVAVFAMVLAYVALVAAYIALRTLAKLRRSSAVLNRGVRGESVLEVTERISDQTALLTEQLAELREYVDRTATATANGAEALATSALSSAVTTEVQRVVQAELGKSVGASVSKALAAAAQDRDDEPGALRHVALVRYDAFSETSGRLSFSLALLAPDGDGVVISAIAAPTETRVYAKGVAAGRGEHELSPEEQQAVSSALKSRRTTRPSRKAG